MVQKDREPKDIKAKNGRDWLERTGCVQIWIYIPRSLL